MKLNDSPYADLKVAWHLDRVQQLRDTGRTVPAQIQLILSDLCNQDCSFCAYRLSGYESNQNFGDETGNNPKRFIPAAKAIEILEDAKDLGVLAVQFTGGGEPTVHPGHMNIFAEALRLGLKCALVTNGVLLRGRWNEVLPQFSWIRVSLDAGTPETYGKVRRTRPDHFWKALGNVSALRTQRDMQHTGCTIGTSFIVTRENYLEAEDAALMAKKFGADSIRFGAMFGPAGSSYYDGVFFDASLSDAKKHEDKDFSVIDMVRPRIMDQTGPPAEPLCSYQQMNVYIGGDLNVYRCCDLAYNDRGRVGGLQSQTFKEFWLDKKTILAYQNFDARGCRVCAFRKKNEVLAALVKRREHVEFV